MCADPTSTSAVCKLRAAASLAKCSSTGLRGVIRGHARRRPRTPQAIDTTKHVAAAFRSPDGNAARTAVEHTHQVDVDDGLESLGCRFPAPTRRRRCPRLPSRCRSRRTARSPCPRPPASPTAHARRRQPSAPRSSPSPDAHVFELTRVKVGQNQLWHPWRAGGGLLRPRYRGRHPVISATFPFTEAMARNVLHPAAAAVGVLAVLELDAEQRVLPRSPPRAAPPGCRGPPYSSASVVHPSSSGKRFRGIQVVSQILPHPGQHVGSRRVLG